MLSKPKVFITSFLLLLAIKPAEARMAYSEELATATIVMEASGEGEDGLLAVAFVLVNRVHDGRWGPNLASVVLAPEQFSGWNTHDPNRRRIAGMKTADRAILLANAALKKALSGAPDPTCGATHYYSVDMPSPPPWAAKGHFLVQIGKHRFYNQVP